MDNLKTNYKCAHIIFKKKSYHVNIQHTQYSIISNYTKKISGYYFSQYTKKKNIVIPNSVKYVCDGTIKSSYIFEITNNLKSYETHESKVFTDYFLEYNTYKTENKCRSILNIIFQHSLLLDIVEWTTNIFLFENIHSFITYTDTNILCHHKNIIIFKNAKKIILNTWHKSIKNLTACRNIYYLYVDIMHNNIDVCKLCNVFLISIDIGHYSKQKIAISKLVMTQHTLKLMFSSTHENYYEYNFTCVTKIIILNIQSSLNILTTKTLNTIGTVHMLHIHCCCDNILNKYKYVDYISIYLLD